ncbi:MAG: L,D-transpeptidase family protein [Solobacterium sp.]|nr:L,D-transpeptidase family protein [Solobacterium sp.]
MKTAKFLCAAIAAMNLVSNISAATPVYAEEETAETTAEETAEVIEETAEPEAIEEEMPESVREAEEALQEEEAAAEEEEPVSEEEAEPVTEEEPAAEEIPEEEVIVEEAEETTATEAFEAADTKYAINITGGTAKIAKKVVTEALEGDKVKVTADKKDHYEFVNWELSKNISVEDATASTIEFTMPAEEVTLTAVYEKLYTVTVNSGTSSAAEAKKGDSVTVTAEEKTNFVFTGWTSKQVAASSDESYTFTMPAGNVKLTANFKEIDRWIRNDTGWRYRKDGAYATGWQTINGKDYYFSKSGYMASSVFKEKDGKTYWLKSSGARQTTSGWIRKDGKYYYLTNDGSMFKTEGFKKIDGKLYYFRSSGAMATDWVKDDGSWYYFTAKGTMVTGIRTIDSKRYYFKDNGVMVVSKWVQLNGSWFYFSKDGSALTGWQTVGRKTYYFRPNGRMATKWAKNAGKYYYFDANGRYVTGMQTIDGNKYFFESNGVMKTGWKKIKGEWYYFQKTGEMVYGWQKIKNEWYYFDSKGVMLKYWQTIKGKKYYLNDDGHMQGEGWANVDGTMYYFTASGALKTGWVKDGSKWYYLDSNYKKVTGDVTIGGTTWHFAYNGQWIDVNLNKLYGYTYPFMIYVNKSHNCITVYAKDDSGNYTIPFDAFICSTGTVGNESPSGYHTITAQYRWAPLMGDVWGQYSSRITPTMLFHSVPCSAPRPDALIADCYNYLGERASHGCIRVTVRDAKWIYEHCRVGTPLYFFWDESSPGPLGKPTAMKLSYEDPKCGWDPTDPDPNNPWHEYLKDQ